MFRLNEQISAWCATAAERARLSKVEVEELRDHLSTEVRRQQSLGATDQRAFQLAIEQLGSVDDLSREYSKNKRLGHAIGTIASIPYGTKVLGIYLLIIAVLMSFFHTLGFVGIFLSGADRPSDFADLTVAAFLVYALWMWLPFVWGGIVGFGLLRGREPGPGTLLGLVLLLAVQVPVFGAQPLPAFELSGGLQLTVLLGPVEGLFEFRMLPEIHMNAPAGEPRYFGINIIAMLAFLFTLARFLDYVLRNEARIHAAQALG